MQVWVHFPDPLLSLGVEVHPHALAFRKMPSKLRSYELFPSVRDFHVVLFSPATSAQRSSWKASSPENGNPTAVLSHDTWYMTIPSHKIIQPKTNIILSNFCISSEELTKLHFYVYISTRSLHPLHLQRWLACWPCRSLAFGAGKEEFNDE
jgi:hypothetical protein